MPYPSYQSSANRYHNPTSRYVGIVFVVVLHAFVIYGLVYLLGSKAIEVIRGPIKVSDIKEEKPKEDDVKPPPPKVDQPPPAYVPPPEINIAAAPVANTTALSTVTNTKPTAPPPPAAPPAPKAVSNPVPMKSSEQPAYPALSRRLEEEGSITIKVLVGMDGSVTDAQVIKSTGFPRLDAAALDFAKTRKYHPGMADGMPVQAWYTYVYRFVLD